MGKQTQTENPGKESLLRESVTNKPPNVFQILNIHIKQADNNPRAFSKYVFPKNKVNVLKCLEYFHCFQVCTGVYAKFSQQGQKLLLPCYVTEPEIQKHFAVNSYTMDRNIK